MKKFKQLRAGLLNIKYNNCRLTNLLIEKYIDYYFYEITLIYKERNITNQKIITELETYFHKLIQNEINIVRKNHKLKVSTRLRIKLSEFE